MLHIVIAVLCAEGRVLIAKRQSHQHLAGLWEFPGGKIEAGETPIAALIREIKEELNITTSTDDYQSLITIPVEYPDRKLLLDVYIAHLEHHQTLSACGHEGQEIRWAEMAELKDVEFPPINQAIVAALEERLA